MLFPLTAFSQHFMFGVHGGVMPTTAPFGSGEYFTNFKNAPAMLVGAKAGIDTRKIQAGIGCNITSVAYTRDLAEKVHGVATANLLSYHHSSPYLNPFLFLNYKKNFLRSFIYIGANAGIVKIGAGSDEAYTTGNQLMGEMTTQARTGFAGGLQAGARIKAFDGFGILAEASMRFHSASPYLPVHDLSLQSGYWQGSFVAFPIVLGVDYIF